MKAYEFLLEYDVEPKPLSPQEVFSGTSTPLVFWGKPRTSTFYDVETRSMDHTTVVIKNPKLFDMEEYFKHNKPNEDDDYSEDIIKEVNKSGWVRASIHESYNSNGLDFSVQSTNKQDIFKLVRMFVKYSPKPLVELSIDYQVENADPSYYSHQLKGDRLEYYLKRGQIPSKMVQEKLA